MTQFTHPRTRKPNAAIEVAVQKNKKIKQLEDRLFALGEMAKAPCFCCGYNGVGYFQPDQHPCANRHHALSNDPALAQPEDHNKPSNT